MYFGLALFYKNRVSDMVDFDKVIKIFKDIDIKLSKFEFLEKDSDKWIKVKNLNKIVQYFENGKFSSMLALSNNEHNSFSISLDSTDDNYYFPYDMQITIDKSNYNEIESFICNCMPILKPSYSFLTYNKEHKFIQEELSFTPISDGWLTGDFDEEREKYLLELQRRRNEIGKIIPQMYPVNYFLTSENVNILKDLKNKLNKDWIFEENGDYTIVKYKEMIPWEEFEKVKNGIKLD